MEPLELALKTYRKLNPLHYLQRTHNARIYDIFFDGTTFMLFSESSVGRDPFKPSAYPYAVFSRYRATFGGVSKLAVFANEAPAPVLADFMTQKIRYLIVDFPDVRIQTDDYEIRFVCTSFDVTRFAPSKE